MKIGDLSFSFKIEGSKEAEDFFKKLATDINMIASRSQNTTRLLGFMARQLINMNDKLGGKKSSKQVKEQTSNLKKFKEQMISIGSEALKVGGSIYIMAKALDGLAKSTLKMNSDIALVSNLTGSSPQGIQNLIAKANIAGVSTDAVKNNLLAITKITGGLKSGSTNGLGVFQKYNVDPYQDALSVFMRLGAAMNQSKLSRDKKVYDLSSLGLDPTYLMMFERDFSKYTKNIRIQTNSQVAIVQEAVFWWNSLQETMRSFSRQIGAEVSPAIVKTVSDFQDLLSKNKDGVDGLISNISGLLSKIVNIGGNLATTATHIATFGNGLGGTTVIVTALTAALIKLAQASKTVRTALGITAVEEGVRLIGNRHEMFKHIKNDDNISDDAVYVDPKTKKSITYKDYKNKRKEIEKDYWFFNATFKEVNEALNLPENFKPEEMFKNKLPEANSLSYSGRVGNTNNSNTTYNVNNNINIKSTEPAEAGREAESRLENIMQRLNEGSPHSVNV